MEPAAQLIWDILAKSARSNPPSQTAYSHQPACIIDVLQCIRTEQIGAFRLIGLLIYYSGPMPFSHLSTYFAKRNAHCQQ